MTKPRTPRPSLGVFILWDDTLPDGTTATRHALWANRADPKTIGHAKRYARALERDHANVRVRIYTKQEPRP